VTSQALEEKPWRGSTGADNLERQWHVAGPTDPGSSAPAGLELKTLCLTHGHRQLLVVSRALFSWPHETNYSPDIPCLCIVGSAAMTPEQDVSWLLASHLSLARCASQRAKSPVTSQAGFWLLIYACELGTVVTLAEQTAQQLPESHVVVAVAASEPGCQRLHGSSAWETAPGQDSLTCRSFLPPCPNLHRRETSTGPCAQGGRPDGLEPRVHGLLAEHEASRLQPHGSRVSALP
jgi:hypothetical protein